MLREQSRLPERSYADCLDRSKRGDPKQKKPVPLLKWVEDRLQGMLKTVLPDNRIDYDVLPNLFMMAYDGFVINRRLNDLRDIERLSNAMCDILLGPPGK